MGKNHRYAQLLLVCFLLCGFWHQNVQAQAVGLSDSEQLARALFEELIEINTTDAHENTTEAAEAMAARLIPVR